MAKIKMTKYKFDKILEAPIRLFAKPDREFLYTVCPKDFSWLSPFEIDALELIWVHYFI